MCRPTPRHAHRSDLTQMPSDKGARPDLLGTVIRRALRGSLKTFAHTVMPEGIYGPIRARWIRRLISRYEPRMVEHDYAGFSLRVCLEDPLAEGWYDRDWEEPAEIAELRRGRLRAGATVFDIGAHQGIVGLILARIVGEQGRIVAVEAELHNALVAERNIAANGVHNMTVMAVAAGATDGVVSFTQSLNGHVAPAGRPGSIEVPVTTVDNIARRYGHPDVVFIDVEGFEAHVLSGASATIASRETDFFVELHSARELAAAGSNVDDVVRHFDNCGFDVRIAIADDTPPGIGRDDLMSGWEGLESGLHTHGRRCFVVATAKPCIPSDS